MSLHASAMAMPVMSEGMEIWRLRSRYSDFRCLQWPIGVGWELRIYQDADLVVQEMFPSETQLLERAQQLQKNMQRRGWHVVET